VNVIRCRYAVLLVALTACSADEMAMAPRARPADTSVARSESAAKHGFAAVPAPPPAPEAPGQALGGPPPNIQDSAALMIIRTGTARIEVDSLERAIASVRAMIARYGGFVVNVAMETGEEQIRRASLELKVPAARFDEVLQQLEPVGDVEAVEVTAQDVGEEYVDATARVANARRLEERLVQLLTTRTGKLDDVLAVERELARVREEIERIEGRLRYLRTRVALSTLTVLLQEPAPLVSPPGRNILGLAFLQSWRNFVGFVASLIAALGFIAPLTLIVGALAWAGRHAWRQTRRAAA
jgi:acetolactate synthase regulatory subunit